MTEEEKSSFPLTRVNVAANHKVSTFSVVVFPASDEAVSTDQSQTGLNKLQSSASRPPRLGGTLPG